MGTDRMILSYISIFISISLKQHSVCTHGLSHEMFVHMCSDRNLCLTMFFMLVASFHVRMRAKVKVFAYSFSCECGLFSVP